jgi:hypothetical protein
MLRIIGLSAAAPQRPDLTHEEFQSTNEDITRKKEPIGNGGEAPDVAFNAWVDPDLAMHGLPGMDLSHNVGTGDNRGTVAALLPTKKMFPYLHDGDLMILNQTAPMHAAGLDMNADNQFTGEKLPPLNNGMVGALANAPIDANTAIKADTLPVNLPKYGGKTFEKIFKQLKHEDPSYFGGKWGKLRAGTTFAYMRDGASEEDAVRLTRLKREIYKDHSEAMVGLITRPYEVNPAADPAVERVGEAFNRRIHAIAPGDILNGNLNKFEGDGARDVIGEATDMGHAEREATAHAAKNYADALGRRIATAPQLRGPILPVPRTRDFADMRATQDERKEQAIARAHKLVETEIATASNVGGEVDEDQQRTIKTLIQATSKVERNVLSPEELDHIVAVHVAARADRHYTKNLAERRGGGKTRRRGAKTSYRRRSPARATTRRKARR